MMTTPYTHERHVAELAVLRASILTKRVQSTICGMLKGDNTEVTVADFAVQALLIKALREAFPSDEFLGEEDSTALRQDASLQDRVYELVSSCTGVGYDSSRAAEQLSVPSSAEEMMDLIDLGGQGMRCGKGRCWVMDPIDGTATFLRGQQYAVSLALIEDGREVIGVLGCPNISAEMTSVSEQHIDRYGLGVMLTAIRGQGSTIRTMSSSGLGTAAALKSCKHKSAYSEQLHIVDCSACTTDRHDAVAQLANHFDAPFPNTDIWSSHVRYAALIISGGDVTFRVPASSESKMYIWDHAGSQLIFTELGGRITDLDGYEIDFCAGRELSRNRGLVAARGDVHQPVLAAMEQILGGRVSRLADRKTAKLA